MPRIVHFEINADDPQRAVNFYTQVFGWNIEKWDGPMEYWLVTTGEPSEPGIDGGIMRRENPHATTINTVDVFSVDDFINKVESNGGKVLMPKMAVPGVGYMAYCQDTEGNTFGLMENDPEAK